MCSALSGSFPCKHSAAPAKIRYMNMAGDTGTEAKKQTGGGMNMLVLSCIILGTSLRLAYHRTFQWVPKPTADTVAGHLFSEQRALRHVHDLVNGIGDRQISSPGLPLATKYMMEQVKAIANSDYSRNDMEVQVDLETVSGAVAMSFTGINFTNAYRHLDNVVLKVTPKALQGYPAVLISSHYDSAVCSKGASDDASQVAVMLELARALVYRKDNLPASPVIFLWTGGEEAISPAGNGWATYSKHYKDVGAFINLESMGGGGVPIIFQHTGAWVLSAFASGAPHPRGSRVAQDIFDLHLIPADSDFRMFSARHYGSLPGIDIAFVLDSTAYHSYLDTPERMRPGNLQEMGEALLGGIYPVAQELAHQHKASAHKDPMERAVFFDVLGYFMVEYPDTLAYTIHNVPLALLLASPLVQTFTEGRPVGPGYVRLMASTMRGLMTILGAVGLPALLAAARVLLLGKPMVFYAQHWLAPALFLPISLAGALAPWHRIRLNARRNEPTRKGSYLASQMHGCGLISSIIGSGLTAAGLMGSAAIFSWCSMVAFILGLIMQGPWVSGPRVLGVLAFAFVPVAVTASTVGLYVVVLLERMAMSGAGISVLADVLMGVLHGATLLASSCGALLPVLAYAIPGGHKRLTASLLGFSLLLAAWSHMYVQPYTPTAPKRMVINHFVFTEADPAVSTAQHDQIIAMRTVNESIAIAGADSTALEQAIDVSKFTRAPVIGREHDVVFPLTNMLRGIVVNPPDKRPRERSAAATTTGTDSDGTASSAAAPAASASAATGGGSSGGSLAAPSPSPSPAASEAHTPWTKWLAAQQQQQREKQEREQAAAAAAAAAAAQGAVRGPAAPFVQLQRVETVGCEGSAECDGRGKTRLHMRMYSEKPYWGILNITGRLVDWSFTRDLAAVHASSKPGSPAAPCTHIVRLTSQDPDPSWHFWVDVEVPASAGTGTAASGKHGQWGVHVELSIVDLTRTEVLEDVLALLPDYVAETWLSTVHHSHWDI